MDDGFTHKCVRNEESRTFQCFDSIGGGVVLSGGEGTVYDPPSNPPAWYPMAEGYDPGTAAAPQTFYHPTSNFFPTRLCKYRMGRC